MALLQKKSANKPEECPYCGEKLPPRLTKIRNGETWTQIFQVCPHCGWDEEDERGGIFSWFTDQLEEEKED